jgi:hypothetical protein
MRADDLVLVQGLRDTRGTLAAWSRRPWRLLGAWVLGSALVAVALLYGVYVVSKITTPDPLVYRVAGVNTPPSLHEAGFLLYRNLLVLALHAMVCVACFIARSSLPAEAVRYGGRWRRVHDAAGNAALGFVTVATLFSLTAQAYALGATAASLAAQLHITPLSYLVSRLPHAIPELTALFLPLSASLIAVHRNRWHELLAATFVTVAVAVPVLVVCSLVEVYVSPRFL